MTLIENYKNALDNKDFGGAVMNLSKALYSINHDLLIAKLHTFDFNNDSLKLLYSYLNNR